MSITRTCHPTEERCSARYANPSGGSSTCQIGHMTRTRSSTGFSRLILIANPTVSGRGACATKTLSQLLQSQPDLQPGGRQELGGQVDRHVR